MNARYEDYVATVDRRYMPARRADDARVQARVAKDDADAKARASLRRSRCA